MSVFSSTLTQTMFLFSLIAIGYFLAKKNFIPDNSATVLSKLENMIFVPALVLGTFIDNFTVERIGSAWKLLVACTIMFAVALPIAIIASKLITKDKYHRNIYTYGLSFSNFGFMGNAVVKALFPEIFFEYLIFVMPLWIAIYMWGVPALLISDAENKQSFKSRFKALINPMFIAMFIGMIIGITGIKLPQWIASVITVSGECMSPIAMLLTGITVSSISLKKTFTDWEIYILSIVRLVIIPLIFVVASRFIPMEHTIFVCGLCSIAMPLGLNTIVVPSAYGKDTTAAAGMALISHLLSCITIPLIFMLI